MTNYVDEIQTAGITNEEIEKFKSKIKTTMEFLFKEYEYEPNNKKGSIDAIQSMMFKTIVSDSKQLDWDVKNTFNKYYSDFKNEESSKAVGSLKIILGSAMGVNFEGEKVNRDIRTLGSLIMKRNYESS
jgi:uncharacterized membrane-anchored protein YjiN (DUF445 family)